MTESMFTVRLSSVMTGCGGNETTCSRRSISGRTRSTYGTTSASPGWSVRRERPRRSTTPARAGGTIRIERATVTSTTNAIARTTIRPAVISTTSSFGDQGSHAVDLQDIHASARFEHVALVIWPRGPDLAADLHLTMVGVDALHDHGTLPDQRRGARPERRRRTHVPARDRPDDGERRGRAHHEHGDLDLDRSAEGRHDRRQRRGDRDRAEKEAKREDLADRHDGRRDRPCHPVGHGLILCVESADSPSRGGRAVRAVRDRGGREPSTPYPAASSARSTSAIRSAGSSQPTLIRMKPSPTSLPDQRARRSADEWTPPKLVASATSRDAARKRSARSRVPRSNASTAPNRLIWRAASSCARWAVRPGQRTQCAL